MLVPSLMQPAPGWVTPGRRIYAVGDVHGCAERLDALHALIAADLAKRPVADARLVHLGAFIDRGADSAGVVARLAAGSPFPGVPMVALRGNHEQMMLTAMTGNRDAIAHWRSNGGDAALRSWGIKPSKAGRDWLSGLPASHVAVLRSLQLTHSIDGYVFVHAGVRPGVPLAAQVEDDLLWIRRPFLDSKGPMLPEAPGLVIVHGHTPTAAPSITRNRIGVDTGAVAGGKLTCAALEGALIRFLAV
jgi:serine/threonine protein phosphatase 1